MRVIQDKQQVRLRPPAGPDQGGSWADPTWVKKARPSNTADLLELPPGMDNRDQRNAEINEFGYTVNGRGGDFTNDEIDAASLKRGFSMKSDPGTDDDPNILYVDVGGFVPRGNLLDRSS